MWLKIFSLATSHKIGMTHGPIKGAGLHICVVEMFWKLAGTGLDARSQLLSISDAGADPEVCRAMLRGGEKGSGGHMMATMTQGVG